MAIPRSLLEKIQTVAPDSAWKAIFEYTWDICSAQLTATSASKEVFLFCHFPEKTSSK